MEEVHGVDVSWLHKPKSREASTNGANDRERPAHRRHISAAPVFNNGNKIPKPKLTTDDVAQQRKAEDKGTNGLSKVPSAPAVTPPTPVQPRSDTTNAVPSTPTPASSGKNAPKRPNILGRQSSAEDTRAGSRRQ